MPAWGRRHCGGLSRERTPECLLQEKGLELRSLRQAAYSSSLEICFSSVSAL